MSLTLNRMSVWLLTAALVIAGAQSSHAGILDDITASADAAYGLRQLSDTYVGPAIRVRRGGDNLEMDIGFTVNGRLDVGSLEAFVAGGNGDGFIRTWYNQSSANVNVAGAVEGASAEQPKIAEGGSVLRAANGLPAIRFDGGPQNLHDLGTGGLIDKTDVFTIAEFSAQPGDNQLDMRLFNLANGGSTRLSAGGDDGLHAVAQNTGSGFVDTPSGTAIVLDEVFLSTLIADGTAGSGSEFIRYELNGDQILEIAGSSILDNDNNLILGNQEEDGGPRGLEGFIQEFLLFSGSSNLSDADRQAITQNLLSSSLIIPEPGSIAIWSLLVVGLIGHGLWRRRS